MSGPKRLGDLLGAVLARSGYGSVTLRLELERAWAEAAGPEVARHARVGSERNGNLEILVDNAALLQELEGFRKEELLEAVGRSLPGRGLKSLRFRRR